MKDFTKYSLQKHLAGAFTLLTITSFADSIKKERSTKEESQYLEQQTQTTHPIYREIIGPDPDPNQLSDKISGENFSVFYSPKRNSKLKDYSRSFIYNHSRKITNNPRQRKWNRKDFRNL
jgi:hypothetical protein